MLDTLRRGISPRIAVIGDFCLDKYLFIDPALDELSLETGLTAYQVTKRALYPGGAGCVTQNLRALGADVMCIGIVGDDGDGFELLRALTDIGADISGLVRTGARATCTYTKPMRIENETYREMNRIDIRGHIPMPSALEDAVIAHLERVLGQCDAVLIQDQFVEDDFGVVTRRVREAIERLSAESDRVFYADSRGHIGDFRGVAVKCNQHELARALGAVPSDAGDVEFIARQARMLFERTLRPVFVTMGELGQIACDGEAVHVPAFPYEGPTDIVGAGDACSAGTTYALALGLSAGEAARVGNAAASLVIRQIGVTGTASLEEVIRLIEEGE